MLWVKACTLIPKKHTVILRNMGPDLLPGDQHYKEGLLKMGDIQDTALCSSRCAVFTGLDSWLTLLFLDT